MRLRAPLAAALALACAPFAPISVRAQAPPASFTLAQAFSYPFPDQLTAAARGERIAWVFNLRGERNVWVADGPGYAARQLTHYHGDNGMPIASLRLTPDGGSALYALGSETNAQGQVADPTSNVRQPQQQVWMVPVTGGAPRLLGAMNCAPEGCEDIEISPDGKYAVWSGRGGQLWLAPLQSAAPAHPLAYIRGNNTQPRWSPDSREIAFVSNRGTHSLIAIYRLGASNLVYVAPSVFHDTLPRWSPDGSSLAFIRLGAARRAASSDWSIWLATSPDDGTAHSLWHAAANPNGAYPAEGSWEDDAFQFASPDRIVFASQADGWPHLYSIATSGDDPLLLTPGAFSFEGPVTLTPDHSALLYASNQNDVDRRHIWRVSVTRADAQALTQGASIEWAPTPIGDGHTVAYFSSTATRPAMPFYRTGEAAPHEIAAAALAADYPSAQMVTPRPVIFTSADGLQIHGQLFVPRGRTRPGPALVFMHGGPYRQMMLGFHPMDAYNYMYAANQFLASRGYVVLSVNYRLSIQYGRAFDQPAGAGARGASEYQDIVAGAKYLQSLPIVDPNRIGLWGGSYGGYLTALGLARNSDIFKAGVDYAGVHDWTTIRAGAAADFPDRTGSIAYQSSPVASIARWKSPVLLIQADDDRNVPFAQTVDLVPLLEQHHIPYQLIVLPDEIHDSLLWRTWMRVFSATAAFFDQTLNPTQP